MKLTSRLKEIHKAKKTSVDYSSKFRSMWSERPDKKALAQKWGYSFSHLSNIAGGRKNVPKRLKNIVTREYNKTFYDRQCLSKAFSKGVERANQVVMELLRLKRIKQSTAKRYLRGIREGFADKDFKGMATTIRQLAYRFNMTLEDIFDLLYPTRGK